MLKGDTPGVKASLEKEIFFILSLCDFMQNVLIRQIKVNTVLILATTFQMRVLAYDVRFQ